MLFYRVANTETNQGLWYDMAGKYTGLIHTKFNFCTNSGLQMPFNEKVIGYLSATQNLPELFSWFNREDIKLLAEHGYAVIEYEATDFRHNHNHWLINAETSKIVRTVDFPESNLKVDQKVFFVGEQLPMKIMAISDRYAAVSRKINKQHDRELIQFEVTRGSYSSFKIAYEKLKDVSVYSLIDFDEAIKGPDNLIFGDYEYSKKEDCERAIKDLKDGEIEISHRHRVELLIDWTRTNQHNGNT